MTNNLLKKPLFRIAGDRGLLVEYGDVIDPIINQKVRAMAMVMEKESIKGVIETIPTYRSLLIIYDPTTTNPTKLEKEIIALEKRLSQIKIPPSETVEIPVCYGGEFGPDIQFVAKHNSITEYQVRTHLHNKLVFLQFVMEVSSDLIFSLWQSITPLLNIRSELTSITNWYFYSLLWR